MLVLTRVGKEWRFERARDSLWPCDIPTSPEHCRSNESARVCRHSFQQFSYSL